VTSVL